MTMIAGRALAMDTLAADQAALEDMEQAALDFRIANGVRITADELAARYGFSDRHIAAYSHRAIAAGDRLFGDRAKSAMHGS